MHRKSHKESTELQLNGANERANERVRARVCGTREQKIVILLKWYAYCTLAHKYANRMCTRQERESGRAIDTEIIQHQRTLVFSIRRCTPFQLVTIRKQ